MNYNSYRNASKEEINSLIIQNIEKFNSTADCLANISVLHQINLSSIKNAGWEFCERFFRRRRKAILNGNTDCKSVFLFLFLFFYFKIKIYVMI
jgi:hypothetical protein